MTDPKDPFYKARRRARRILEASGFVVTTLADGPFDIEGMSGYAVRKIKICLGAISKTDRTAIEKVEIPLSCTKEIWLKKKGVEDFDIIKIHGGVNIQYPPFNGKSSR